MIYNHEVTTIFDKMHAMSENQISFAMKPIGIIHSCFKEKFGIPRQPGIVPEASATLELFPEFSRPEAVRDMDGYSHLWLIFLFHESVKETWKPTVRPPRLGGNKKTGVFASRSPFRPNPIGLSAVKLEGVDIKTGIIYLHLSGIDILDGTPVLDIKPYLPYSDIIPSAVGGFASSAPPAQFNVDFSTRALETLELYQHKYPNLKQLIIQILENDPRPAYYPAKKNNQTKVFGMKLYEFDVKWTLLDQNITVTALDKIDS